MKKIIIILSIIGLLVITIGIVLLNYPKKEDNKLSKDEAVKVIGESLKVDNNKIKFLTESPETYRYEVLSDDEEIAGIYVVDKETKLVAKEYTDSTENIA